MKVALQESGYAFIRDLFARARAGSVFLFTDATDRLWPAISRLGGHALLSFIFLLRQSDPKHALLMVKQHSGEASPLVEIARGSQIAERVEEERPCGPRRCLFVNGGGEAVEQYLEQAQDHLDQA